MKTLLLLAALGACATQPTETTSDTASALSGFHREHVRGDLYHYWIDTPAGRVHRVTRELAPFAPRPAAHAAMLLHGDFSTFVTNFLDSGLAPYLAERGEDVWGVDRRWATIPADGDTAPLATMGISEELRDLRGALALARATRHLTGDPDAKLTLVGFSHGAQIAYTYAAYRGGPDVGAVAALDFYAGLGADQTDARAAICANADAEYGLVAGGTIDSTNDFFIALGELARSAPDDPSPLWDGLTNRQAFLTTAGQTYRFVPFAPLYHLLAPTLDATSPDAPPTGLRSTPDLAGERWFASAPLHQSMLESADLDELLCTDNAAPIAAPIANIHVPLFYLGAAGGVGALGTGALSRTGSHDITSSIITLGGDAAEDYGHGDVLFARDAAARAWQPLATWLAVH